MKIVLLSIVCFGLFFQKVEGQCSSCSAITYNFDLSASVDTSVTIQSTRNGNCCNDNNCIRFNVIVNPACSYVNFSVANPSPSGSANYQINCGPLTSIGVPACIVGQPSFCISYCKPGNDNPYYTITVAGAIQKSPDVTVREGCTNKIGIKGLITSTIQWTSIYPAPVGAYNSYLSCLTACDTVTVSPQPGAPSYIDYQVSGSRICGGTVYDTIRVYTQPQMTVNITPPNPLVCPGGTSNIVLTASPSGGDAPYSFLWNTTETTPSISVNTAGTYTVIVSDSNSNCAAVSQSVIVGLLPTPPAPIVTSNSPLCEGNTLQLFASTIPGATYSWTGPNGFTSSQQNPIINNITMNEAGTYSVFATVNGCIGSVSTITVTVNPIPSPPTASNNSPFCENNTLNLFASSISGATYSWTGPNGFTSSLQNPFIPNATIANAGSYQVSIMVNGCQSPSQTTTVVIDQPAIANAGNNQSVCVNTSSVILNGTVTGGGNTGIWSSSGSGSFIPSNTNLNASYIPSIADISAGSVQLTLTSTNNGTCAPSISTITITFNPLPAANTGPNKAICFGTSTTIGAATVPGNNYSWTSSPAGFTSTSANPTVNPTVTTVYTLIETITATGCTNSNSVTVTVNPLPLANAGIDKAICFGTSTTIGALGVPGNTYSWTSSPAGFTSTSSNPTVNPTVMTTYTLTETIIATGCTNSKSVVISLLPLPLANAGPNKIICLGSSTNIGTTAVPGNTYSWTSFPIGFTSNNANPTVNPTTMTVYTLTELNISTGCSNQNNVTINIDPVPISFAGIDTSICVNATLKLSGAVLNATGGKWISSGDGIFSPSANNLNATYIPGNADTSGKKVNLMLATTGNGSCPSVASSFVLSFNARPFVNAGSDLYVLEKNSIVLNASVNGMGLIYSWTPANYLNNNTVLNPVTTPPFDMNYKLTVTDKFGCNNSDDVFIKVLKMPVIPNVFTPNGDGINDKWQIKYLVDYPGCTVEIYNRYGQLIYQCNGYNNPWDGNVNGKPVPAATYYYIINPKNGLKPIAGFVDVVK